MFAVLVCVSCMHTPTQNVQTFEAAVCWFKYGQNTIYRQKLYVSFDFFFLWSFLVYLSNCLLSIQPPPLSQDRQTDNTDRNPHTPDTCTQTQTLLASYTTPPFNPASASSTLSLHFCLQNLRDFATEHLQHQWGELHAVLRLEGEWAVLFGVLLVEAAQVGQLLDHPGIKQPFSWVVKMNIGLQGLWQSVLEGFNSCVILHTWAVCGRGAS